MAGPFFLEHGSCGEGAQDERRALRHLAAEHRFALEAELTASVNTAQDSYGAAALWEVKSEGAAASQLPGDGPGLMKLT